MSRGFTQAEKDTIAFNKKAQSLAAAQSKAGAASAAAQQSAQLAAFAGSKQFASLQSNVVDAVRKASVATTKAYNDRQRATKEFLAVESAASKKIVDAEAKIAAAKKQAALNQRKTAALDKISTIDSRGKRIANEGTSQSKVNAQAAAIVQSQRKVQQEILASGRIINNANRQIQASAKKTAEIVSAANTSELRSIGLANKAVQDKALHYKNLAASAGPAAQKLASQVEAADQRVVRAEQAVANAREKLENSRNARLGTGGDAKAQAAALIVEQNATRQLKKELDNRRRARQQAKQVEDQFTKAFISDANQREAKAKEEAQRVIEAQKQEEQARKQQKSNLEAETNAQLATSTLALVGVVKGATAQWGDYEAALRNAAAISPELRNQMDEVSDSLNHLAVQLGKSPVELANALNEVAQAGFEGSKALEITEAAAKAAAAGMTDATTASLPFIAILNAYGDKAGTVQEISDKLFKSVTEGVFSFEDLSQQLGDNVSIASTLGISLDELLASYVALTKRGNNLSESTTQINAVMNAFLKPSEALQAAIKGISNETAQTFIRTHDFGEVLQTVSKLLSENADAAGQLFPNIRAIRGIFGLTAAEAKEFDAQQKNLNNTMDATGGVMDILAFKSQGLNFQLAQAKEQGRQFAIAIGKDMAPGLKAGAIAFALTAHAAQAFDSATGGLVGTAIGVTAALSAFAFGLSSSIRLAKVSGGAIKKLATIYKGYTTSVLGASRANAIFSLTGGLVVAGVALAAFAVYKLYQAHKKQEQVVKELKQAYEDLATSIKDVFTREDLTVQQAQAWHDLGEEIASANTEVLAAQKALSDASEVGNIDELLKQFPDLIQKNIDGTYTWATALDSAGGVIETATGTLTDLGFFMADGAIGSDKFTDALQKFKDILNTTGIDIGLVNAELDPLIDAFLRGVPGAADALAKGIDNVSDHLDNYKDHSNDTTNAQVSLGKSLINTEQFFGSAADQADTLRQGLKSLTDATLTAGGALDNMDSPLEFVQNRIGGVGDSIAQTLLHLQELGDVNFNTDQIGALQAVAELDRIDKEIAKVEEAFKSSDDVIGVWQQRMARVKDLVGSQADGFKSLKDMVDRHKISQEDANKIQKAAIFLNEKAKISIDDERVAEAKQLPALAAFVQAHDNASGSFNELSDEQKGFAAALSDTTNQMIVMTVVMLKLAAAMNPDAFDESFLDEFLRQLAVANPEAAALLDTMGLLPDSMDVDVKASIDVGQLDKDLATVDKKIKDVQADIIHFSPGGRVLDPDAVAHDQKVLALLQKKRYQISIGVDTSDVDTELANIDSGIADVEDAAQETGDKWSDIFARMSDDTQSLNDFAADTTEQVLETLGALNNFDDPLSFINHLAGTKDLPLLDILGEVNDLAGKPIKLTVDDRDALNKMKNLHQTEKKLADLDDQIQTNNNEMSEWQQRIDLVDSTLGTSEDTYAQYEAQLAAGTITQQEFNDAVASGDAHRAYADLNQLVESGRLTQEQADDALKAGIFIRERSTKGIFDERAANALALKDLATLIQLHDRDAKKVDELTAAQRGFLAGLQDEAVQTALNQVLMLAFLEAMGVVAEGTTGKFIAAAEAGNDLVATIFDNLGITPDLVITVKQDPVDNADAVVDDANNTVDNADPIVIPVKVATDPRVEGIPGQDNNDTVVPDQVVHVTADTSSAERTLSDFQKINQTFGELAGTNFNRSYSQMIAASTGLVVQAVTRGPREVLVRFVQQVEILGEYGGKNFNYGILRGLANTESLVYAFVRRIAGHMAYELFKGLIIRSPSHKGAYAGSQFVLGIIQGAESEEEKLYAKVTGISDKMASSFGGSAKAGMSAMRAGQPILSSAQSFIGQAGASHTSNSSINVGSIPISVVSNGGDPKEISEEVNRQLHASFRRLNQQVV